MHELHRHRFFVRVFSGWSHFRIPSCVSSTSYFLRATSQFQIKALTQPNLEDLLAWTTQIATFLFRFYFILRFCTHWRHHIDSFPRLFIYIRHGQKTEVFTVSHRHLGIKLNVLKAEFTSLRFGSCYVYNGTIFVTSKKMSCVPL